MTQSFFPRLKEDSIDLEVVIRMMMANDPDKMVKALVLTSGGYDPCLFGSVTSCPSSWKVESRLNGSLSTSGNGCIWSGGDGSFKKDPCPGLGGHLPRIRAWKDFDDTQLILNQGKVNKIISTKNC